MRIVHYLESLRPPQGGIVRAVLDLAGGLTARGQRVTVVTCDDADLAAAWAPEGSVRPDIRRIAAPPLPGQLLSRATLRAVAAYCLRGADVLHLHGVWTPSNLQLAHVARNAGIPYVLSPHGALDDWPLTQHDPQKRLYLRLLGRRLLAGATAVHVTMSAGRGHAVGRLSGHRPVAIPPVVDLSAFAQLPPALPREDPPLVLFSGELHRGKGVELLLDAVGLLAEHDFEVRLVIAGLGAPRYRRSLRARARRLGLIPRTDFLGYVPEARKLALYQSAAVFVQPSVHDSLGIPLYEALASGTPVITTTGTAGWRQLQASGGMVLTERTTEEVATELTRLLALPSVASSMGARGRAWVLDNLRPADTAGRFEELYRQVVALGTPADERDAAAWGRSPATDPAEATVVPPDPVPQAAGVQQVRRATSPVPLQGREG